MQFSDGYQPAFRGEHWRMRVPVLYEADQRQHSGHQDDFQVGIFKLYRTYQHTAVFRPTAMPSWKVSKPNGLTMKNIFCHEMIGSSRVFTMTKASLEQRRKNGQS